MPVVFINDEQVEAEEGETLLDVARRCAAHIGFACGGFGICLACVCRVREGLDHISTPNGVERRGMPRLWLDQGYRLACQARIVGPGPIDMLSRPEELWRLTKHAVKPPEGSKKSQNWLNLGRYVFDMSLQQWLIFPMNSLNALYQATRARPTPSTVVNVVKDTGRVLKRMSETDFPKRDKKREEEGQEEQEDTRAEATPAEDAGVEDSRVAAPSSEAPAPDGTTPPDTDTHSYDSNGVDSTSTNDSDESDSDSDDGLSTEEQPSSKSDDTITDAHGQSRRKRARNRSTIRQTP